MPNILITGATGYIGRRLEERFRKDRHIHVRLLVRNKNKLAQSVQHRADYVEGDTFNQKALDKALKGIDVAYYLIHSMGAARNFEEIDRKSAEKFRDAAIAAGVKRIIYLGGLGVKDTASRHLLSRIETGEILSAVPDKIQTIWFRAGVIIGAGSASFEIIRNLVQKLPVMITPSWVRTKTQPIAVDDVISYLESAVLNPCKENIVVDIGTESMSFGEMLKAAARVLGLRRYLIPVPVLSPKLSSYWLILFTPIPYNMAAALVEGLKSETLVLNDNAKRYFAGVHPKSYTAALQEAIAEIEQDQVVSRWCDSSAEEYCDIKDHDKTFLALLRDVREIPLAGAKPEDVFLSICTLGGEFGWHKYHILWRIRGSIDKTLGGYGLSRGRRQRHSLRVGDALDFWKVVDIKTNKRILLLAQMKLPGKAWLEFDIQKDCLVQTAHFLPSGVWGRLYWYLVMPFHYLVFADLARKIVVNAKRQQEKLKPFSHPVS